MQALLSMRYFTITAKILILTNVGSSYTGTFNSKWSYETSVPD